MAFPAFRMYASPDIAIDFKIVPKEIIVYMGLMSHNRYRGRRSFGRDFSFHKLHQDRADTRDKGFEHQQDTTFS